MEEVATYARERLGEVATVFERDEAVKQGLFGPGRLTERAAARIGELLLFPRGNLSLVAPIQNVDGNPPRVPVFRGLHGGLTAEEAVVPFLAVRL
jgi:hypothetical protein